MKLKEKEKEELDRFRAHAQKMVTDFAESDIPSKQSVKICARCQKCINPERASGDQRMWLCLPPMNKFERTIV